MQCELCHRRQIAKGEQANYVARCFSCDWGMTHELEVLRESIQGHLDEGCPGPVYASSPPLEIVHGRSPLRFWRARTRCGACGMPLALGVCVPLN